MKFSQSWLNTYVNINADAMRVADDLVRLGHEVEGVECPRAAVSGVLVGHILSKTQHPDADRLSLLKVDVGADSPLDIVCGASNMDVGDKIPVATVGAELPNGLKIKKGKIRGETSCGMCCSEEELGMAEQADGLLILPADAPVGMEIGEFLGFESAVFDLSITPNRGDCMSVRGIARDLAADAGLPLLSYDMAAMPESSLDAPSVRVDVSEDCPVYVARRIDGVQVGDAPAWMQAHLRDAGQRCVNGVVDVLNYIMLDMGQPMHAFDANTLQGDIVVRHAVAGEAFKALDGRALALAEHNVVIADASKVIALAGVMGSEETGVTNATTSLLLESAFFRPASISTTRRGYAMVSEASMRFERGVDPMLVQDAMHRATAMIVALFGGVVSHASVVGSVDTIAHRPTIDASVARIESRLGVELPASADDVLSRMGFGLQRDGHQLRVEVPSWRHDVSIPEDLSEEYARVIGFDAIPAYLPSMQASTQVAAKHAWVRDAVALGATQVINYAFISENGQELFVADDDKNIVLANPISADMSVMRRSMWPGLLNVAKHNVNRQQRGVALVEHGRIYERVEDNHHEMNMMAWLLTGDLSQDAWYDQARNADFFDLKGMLEAWFSKQGLQARFIADDAVQGLQAGQSARVLVGRNVLGYMGKVDASIAAQFDLDAPVFVVSLNLDALPDAKKAKFTPLPEFPSAERDLVFLFDCATTADDILQTVSKAGGSLLSDARIFDVYTGQGVPDGKVSLGVRFALQAADRSITQEDSDQVFKAIITAVGQRFNATLRG